MENNGLRCPQPPTGLPGNDALLRDIEPLLTPPVGRPSNAPVVWYAGFLYQAKSWNRARRVVAKVEWHNGELFPRLETPPVLKKNRGALGKKGLQIRGEGAKSRKMPTLVVGKNPHGKSRCTCRTVFVSPILSKILCSKKIFPNPSYLSQNAFSFPIHMRTQT
jgi:hypothetical protein